jgi:hypothetical protein
MTVDISEAFTDIALDRGTKRRTRKVLARRGRAGRRTAHGACSIVLVAG